jgi:hypothetical protein
VHYFPENMNVHHIHKRVESLTKSLNDNVCRNLRIKGKAYEFESKTYLMINCIEQYEILYKERFTNSYIFLVALNLLEAPSIL